jgi:hypothetical protein
VRKNFFFICTALFEIDLVGQLTSATAEATDFIVAARRTSEHIVPSYLKITQNDKFSVKVEPFTGNPLCHPL